MLASKPPCFLSLRTGKLLNFTSDWLIYTARSIRAATDERWHTHRPALGCDGHDIPYNTTFKASDEPTSTLSPTGRSARYKATRKIASFAWRPWQGSHFSRLGTRMCYDFTLFSILSVSLYRDKTDDRCQESTQIRDPVSNLHSRALKSTHFVLNSPIPPNDVPCWTGCYEMQATLAHSRSASSMQTESWS